jgi:hypothetical protein
MGTDDLDPDAWYWDRRNRKVHRPVWSDEDTVAFVSVWHRDEVADARSGGALVPAEEAGFGDEATVAPDDSFRFDLPPVVGEADG